MRHLLLLLLLPSLAAAAPALSVGFGEADVSPAVDGKKPVYLAGFGQNRAATKVHDPIMARAVVLSDGTKKIAMVSVDVVGLFLPTVEQARNNLKGFDHVMVSATHNHEGPDTMGLWGSGPFECGVDPGYLAIVVAGIVKAVTAADKALAPATAKIGTAKDADLLNDNREPVVKHDELVALQFENADGKAVGLLVQWNCHPELLGGKNTEASADHVGYTVGHLKAKYKCPVAYFSGSVGGLMTALDLPLKGKDGAALKDGTFEKTERYGVLVGELAEKAVTAAKPITLVPFDVRTQPILVPVENGLYLVAATAGVLKRQMYAWDGDPTPKEFVPAKKAAKAAVKTEVGFLRLGDLDIAAIPGEIYPELVLDKIQDPADKGADYPDAPKEPAIYPAMGGKHKMLIGLANDEIGYILPKRQWDEKKPYCYGRKEAQYGEVNSCGPDVAAVVCGEFKKLTAKK